MRKITQNELLTVGTAVQFQGKRGRIESANWSQDQFRDRICLHKILVTQHARRKWKGGGETGTIWESVKPYLTPVNYSFIRVL